MENNTKLSFCFRQSMGVSLAMLFASLIPTTLGLADLTNISVIIGIAAGVNFLQWLTFLVVDSLRGVN